MRFNHWLQVLPVLTSLQDGQLPWNVSQTNPFLLRLLLPGHFITTTGKDTKLGASYITKGDAGRNQLQDIHAIRKITNSSEGILQAKAFGLKVALFNDSKENKLTIKKKEKENGSKVNFVRHVFNVRMSRDWLLCCPEVGKQRQSKVQLLPGTDTALHTRHCRPAKELRTQYRAFQGSRPASAGFH